MKLNLLQRGIIGVLTLASFFILFSCDDDGSEQTAYQEITLESDKNSIEADGTDHVTFTVKGDGRDIITSKAVITSGDIRLTDAKFSTESEGEFTFVATYGNLRSNSVTVSATSTDPSQGRLVIEVDGIDITSDGKDAMTLTILNKGKNVSKDVTIKGDYNGELNLVDDVYRFTTTTAGDNTFYAESGELKSETVTLYAVEADAKFYRMIGSFRITGIWCGPCTGYSESIKEAEESRPDRLTMVSIHGGTKNEDPMTPPNFSAVNRGLTYGSSSFPTHNIEFREEYKISGNAPAATVISFIDEILKKYPATTGFHVESRIVGDEARINVTVRATQTDNYYLGVILIEDGIAGTQANVTGTYVHDGVFRAIATPYSGIDLKTIEANSSVTTEITMKLIEADVLSNCRLMFYSLNENSEGIKIINNATYAALDGITPYRFEE